MTTNDAATTERFDGYEAELRLVSADLSQKLDQIPEQSGEQRKNTVAQAERLVDEARDLVSVDLLVHALPLWPFHCVEAVPLPSFTSPTNGSEVDVLDTTKISTKC